MRTFTVVPSFEGESAFFELPDIGFQGDHLSFAILFNLTELTEHWPNILPSMIITDPQGNTFIAPNTAWNPTTHIFTWNISSSETAYEGYVLCQLKCTAEDDPATIVCMSRICQTRVYASLSAAADPPEAFQSWIDTLAQLGAQVQADATDVLESVATTESNARAAQAAADDAELAKNAAVAARNTVEQTAQIAVNAQEAANQALQRARQAASNAEAATAAANEAQAHAEQALEDVDAAVNEAESYASSAADSATQAANSMSNANAAKRASEAARDSAIAAQGSAETAQQRAELAEEGALSAQTGANSAKSAAEDARDAAQTAQRYAENARSDAESAQSAAEGAVEVAETARDRAEAARVGVETYADVSRRWAEGKTYAGQDVPSDADQYNNNSKYWARVAEQQANTVLNFGLYVDEEGNGFIRSL